MRTNLHNAKSQTAQVKSASQLVYPSIDPFENQKDIQKYILAPEEQDRSEINATAAEDLIKQPPVVVKPKEKANIEPKTAEELIKKQPEVVKPAEKANIEAKAAEELIKKQPEVVKPTEKEKAKEPEKVEEPEEQKGGGDEIY